MSFTFRHLKHFTFSHYRHWKQWIVSRVMLYFTLSLESCVPKREFPLIKLHCFTCEGMLTQTHVTIAYNDVHKTVISAVNIDCENTRKKTAFYPIFMLHFGWQVHATYLIIFYSRYMSIFLDYSIIYKVIILSRIGLVKNGLILYKYKQHF